MQTAIEASARAARTGYRAFDSVRKVRVATEHVTSASRMRAQVETIGRLCIDLCTTHRVAVQVHGAPPRGPALFVANHLGYLDPMILCAFSPALPIAKMEVASWPILGARAKKLGAFFVDRSDAMSGARVLRQALRALRSGVSVLVFPEGTTTWGDIVLPFRRGSFGIAQRAGVPIVPVRIDYVDDALCWVGEDGFLPHYLSVLARPGIRAAIRYGAPIMPGVRAPASVLASRARAEISRRIVLASGG